MRTVRTRECTLECRAARGRRLFFCFLWCFVSIPAAGPVLRLNAQTLSGPALHRRIESRRLEAEEATVVSRGRTTLPLDVSGEYSLGEEGEAVEIDLERNRLSGYITRFGDRESDQGTPLTFFFATSLLNGRELSFTTHRVHGVWFSFAGTIVRGAARNRTEEGYYRLEGRLGMHDAANGTVQTRDVSLPMARQAFNG